MSLASTLAPAGGRQTLTERRCTAAKESPMFASLTKRLSTKAPRKAAKPAAFRPRIEALEERQMLSGTPLSADADRSLTTPTAWEYYSGVDASFLTAHAQQSNMRITDLHVESTAPYRFTATLVKNAGDYGHAWWWYYGLTAGQLTNTLAQNHARITDLETYFINGERRFAALEAPNTGGQAKSWWYYYGVSPEFVSSRLDQNHARLVDLGRESNGTLDVVMVANQGSDARAWWWYTGISAADVAAKVAQNHARLTELERQSDGNFSVIMEKGQGESWWYYYDQTLSGLSDLAGRNGARITNVESYTVNGQRRYAAVMLNDSNDLTTRVGDLLRAASNTAQVGAYLKQVDGSVLADLQGDRRFEPASMIKVLIHLYAMRQVQTGAAKLTDPITYYFDPSLDPNSPYQTTVHPDSYPHTSANAVVTTLEDALRRMMQNSDNRTTMAVMDHFGKANINAMARALGLTGTVIGSPSPIGDGVPGNYFTLADAAKLYEKVADGTAGVTGATRDKFYELMYHGADGTLAQVVREEAARKLNKPVSDPAVQALANSFLGQVQEVNKGGSYTNPAGNDAWNLIQTVGGWVSLPFKQTLLTISGHSVQVIRQHGYAYGMFVENARAPRNNPDPVSRGISAAMSQAEAELFRGEIRAALATW
jgi:hypothetical protein